MGAGISGAGPPWPTRQGARPRGVGAPCALVAKWCPPGVFSVPDVLKYSTKNHISFSGHLENFYFRGIFIARIILKTDRNTIFFFI